MTQDEWRKLFHEWFSSPHPRIHHFSAGELLAKTDKGRNTIPPIALWCNILPTIQVLDAVRRDLGYPLHINSCFRNPQYNKDIGGATKSMHMKFNAIDFSAKRGSPEEWFAAVINQRSNGMEVGGVGLYDSFVHVDTRTLWKGRKFATW